MAHSKPSRASVSIPPDNQDPSKMQISLMSGRHAALNVVTGHYATSLPLSQKSNLEEID